MGEYAICIIDVWGWAPLVTPITAQDKMSSHL